MGLSDRDVGEYTLENIAEDVLAVLRFTGCGGHTLKGLPEPRRLHTAAHESQ